MNIITGLLCAARIFLASTTTLAQTVPVQVAQVRSADVPVTLQGIGTVEAYNTVTLRAQVDGVLQHINFTEGQSVKAGEPLAQIDPRPFQAALDQAVARKAQDEALLQNARLDLERFQGIGAFASRQQVATQQALILQLEAQVRGDEGAIESARTQLSYTTITSPMDGITGIRMIDQGNLLRAADGTGIVVVTQTKPISVLFTLPAEDLGEIRQAMAAQKLRVSVLERQNRHLLGEGMLELVDNRIDPATGQLRLKATLPNQDGALWPGQFVTASLFLRTDHDVTTVPSTAIQRGPDGPWLYVVTPGNSVVARNVDVTRFEGGLAVLSNGPPIGTTVVTSGQFRLSPGSRVTIAQTSPALTSPAIPQERLAQTRSANAGAEQRNGASR